MPDTYTEVTQRGFGSRLGGALAGFLIGPLLIIGAIVLLSWNEGRAVQAIVGLGEASKSYVEAQAGTVQADNEGLLVHLIGPATAAGPIADNEIGLTFADQVSVARTVEMYQWKEDKKEETRDKVGGGQETTTTYTYAKDWSAEPQDSSQFKHPEGHENPPMRARSARLNAADAKLGAYTLDPATLGLIEPSQALTPAAPEGWSASGDAYYDGDPAVLEVGRQRATYKGLPSGATISVMAAQSQNGFAPFLTDNGYEVHLAALGNRPAKLMVKDQAESENVLTWILRVVGFVLMAVGFGLIFGPLSALAAVVPFLGSLVRGATGIVAFLLAVPLTLVVIALSWVAFRPLVGIALLVVAAAAGFGLWKLKGRFPGNLKGKAAPAAA